MKLRIILAGVSMIAAAPPIISPHIAVVPPHIAVTPHVSPVEPHVSAPPSTHEAVTEANPALRGPSSPILPEGKPPFHGEEAPVTKPFTSWWPYISHPTPQQCDKDREEACK